MSMPKINIFEHSGHLAMFNGQDMSLKLLPFKTNHSLVGNHDHISQKTLNAQQVLFQIQESFGNLTQHHTSYKIRRDTDMDCLPPLDRLTLNISNICNMNCKYCYAGGGTYYTSGILMDRKTALNAINYVFRNFSEIRNVNFFGGEPTLNKPIVELICGYILYLYDHGIFKRLPIFSLTTNGYVIDRHMFEIINKYGFRVSISLDGPKEIHDRLRIDKSLKGTYDAIEKNIKALIDKGIKPEFECTYTNEHERCGFNLIALMDYFYDNFDCHVLHCPIVVAGPDTPWFVPIESCLELYADAIRYSIKNLAQNIPKSISIAARLLNSMSTKSPICHYCPAGQSTITINADGNVYACFMLMHGPEFCMGNVNKQEDEKRQSYLIDALIKNADKQQNPACQNCWAQPLCYGCIGDDFQREGYKIFRSEISGQSDLCDFKRSINEIFLKSITESYF